MKRFRYFKNKQQANNFLQKIYREMTDDCVVWRVIFDKNMPDNTCGLLQYRDSSTVFRLDPCDSVIETFLHEGLHYFYEKASEKVILRMEKELVHWLSARQFENIFIKMSELIWRGRC